MRLAGMASLGSALLLSACGTNGQANEVNVTMVDMTFDPAEIRVPAGATITWINESNFVHTVTTDPSKLRDGSLVSTPDGTIFDSGNLQPGDEWSHTFTSVGEIRYCCAPHELAGMAGRIVVE